jgi:predicted nucleic acid-binding protein
MYVAAPALIETCSVHTRFPTPVRLAPAVAFKLIEASFIEKGEVVALDAHAYVRSLSEAPDQGLTGGRLTDAVIAACANSIGAITLLTFNERHFRQFSSEQLNIVVPGSNPTDS